MEPDSRSVCSSGASVRVRRRSYFATRGSGGKSIRESILPPSCAKCDVLFSTTLTYQSITRALVPRYGEQRTPRHPCSLPEKWLRGRKQVILAKFSKGPKSCGSAAARSLAVAPPSRTVKLQGGSACQHDGWAS